MSKVLQRIKQYYESEGMSSREFSLSIGRSGGYFSTALKKGSEPTADMLSKIFNKYPHLSIVWVFTGCGNMKNSGGQAHGKEKVNRTIDELIEDKIDTKFREIREMIYKMGDKLEKKIQLKILKELQSIDDDKDR